MSKDFQDNISIPQQLKQGEYSNTINVNGVEIAWDVSGGTCTFRGIPVALMWIDSTLAGVMSGMESMVGPERFQLALQAEGRKSVESDWLLIKSYADFAQGFAQLNLNAKVAGWGDWQLVNYHPDEKKCIFRVYNNWEGAYQKALHVCWGSGMIAGKLAGICTKQFQTNCWANQTRFVAKGDPYDEFIVVPSERILEQEIENLLLSDQATRADMAVALKKLQDTEKVLQNINQRYNLLVQRIPDGVYIWRFNPEGGGRFDYVSPRFCEILGINEQEVLNDFQLAFNITHPDDRQRLIEDHENSRITLRPFRWEGRFIVHGETRWIRIASDATPLPNKGSSWNGVISDITERHQAEEQLHQYAKDLQAVNFELENFTFAASHDLQEPSRIILNYVDALTQDLGTDINNEIRDDLRFIHESARRMRNLVQDLESYTQMRKTRLLWKSVDLRNCILEAIRQLQPQIIKHQAQIILDDLPIIWGDEMLLNNAMRHLLENAIKFHHPGIFPYVIISAQQNPQQWEIRIDDNGIGIEPHHREMVFLPCKRLNRRGEYTGSGLGLTFVKEVARRHGGTIRIEQSARHGSIFILSIPIHSSE